MGEVTLLQIISQFMEVENLSCLLKFPSLLTPSVSPCRRTITKLNFMVSVLPLQGESEGVRS